ncbi:MAG: RNA 2',3'-cyclic phosphodiesterase [Candidatus Rokubacteria bacterium]|nr:RNA 2',3'-cyclic phosphodiesterase [Candidatus Rokubacteria bacterium]
MRLFVAILLSAETRALARAEIERLRPLSRAVAWVPPDNLHITLKFLGEQPPGRLEEIGAGLREAAGGSRAFDLALRGLGAFPGLERPKILWIGAAQGALEARGLQAGLDAALAERGFAPESRPWHPHLTIGRVFDERRWQREAGPELRQAVAEAGRRDYGVAPVAALSLVESELRPSGARYAEVLSCRLGPFAGGDP